MTSRGLPEDVVDVLSAFVPRLDLESLRPVTRPPGSWLPVLLRMGAVTIGPFVFFRADRYNLESARGLALIAHEAVHVGQYRELGVLRFFIRYYRERLRVRFRHDRHGMEIPGNDVQRRVRESLRFDGWP